MNRGFVSWIILAIVALAALKFFLNWDIFDAAASDQGKSTIVYIRDMVNLIWKYIGTPLVFIWERIIWPLLSLTWGNVETLIDKGNSLDLPPVSLPTS